MFWVVLLPAWRGGVGGFSARIRGIVSARKRETRATLAGLRSRALGASPGSFISTCIPTRGGARTRFVTYRLAGITCAADF